MLARLSDRVQKSTMFLLFTLALIGTATLMEASADPSAPDDTDSQVSDNKTVEAPEPSVSSPSDSPEVAVKGRQYKNAVAVYSAKDNGQNWSKVQERYEEVQTKARAAQREIDAISNRVKEKKESYEKAKATLSQKERDERETEIRHLNADYAASLDKKQKEIEAEENAIIKWFNSEISVATAIVAARLGCKTVQPRRAMQTSDKTADPKDNPTYVDITALVLEELEQPDWQCAPFPPPATASGHNAEGE